VADQFARQIEPAQGKLGVLCVGLGAVATTFIAGVENVRRGAAKPIGALTQMGTIRLGKRTEGRAPLIKDFAPIADLNDLVFGAWDPVPDDAYQSAIVAGVLDKWEHVEPIKEFLQGIKPMPAVFEQQYVKRLEGRNVKTGKTKRDLAEQLRQDIRDFKAKHGCDRMVMIWCASTEVFIAPGPAHWSLDAFE
jgi:myo-inositol-1-phosphate synthase